MFEEGNPGSGEEPHLVVDQVEHIVTVTMNRPRSKNAFSLEMLARMWDEWQRVDEDPEVRVVILTGAGGDFCAGADLKMMHGNQENNPYFERYREDPDLHWKALLRHYSLKKPLIAAVEGVAVGGGTEILQGTDIRVAAEGAMLGVTEVTWGLFPLGGSTVRLPRQVGYTNAMEMLLTGKKMSAQEAKDVGLVGHVVPRGEALAKAREIAEVIAANGPLAVQAVKKSAKEGLLQNEVEALRQELEFGEPIFHTSDAKEGPKAFMEKRSPQFQGE